MIDFHCHLDLYPDPLAVAAECRKRGVRLLSVTNTPSAWAGTASLAAANSEIFTALGLHPQIAHQRGFELDIFDKIVGTTHWVGEIGLDGAPEFRPHWSKQIEVFEHILNSCSRSGGRIMSIHSRCAAQAVLNRLSSRASGLPILHWFSGSLKELEQANSIGCWFSVGPAMLNSANGRKLVSRMPRARVLTETDGPFAHIDGKPLMPWDSQSAASGIAAVWGLPLKDTEDILNENLSRLIGHSTTEFAKSMSAEPDLD